MGATIRPGDVRVYVCTGMCVCVCEYQNILIFYSGRTVLVSEDRVVSHIPVSWGCNQKIKITVYHNM